MYIIFCIYKITVNVYFSTTIVNRSILLFLLIVPSPLYMVKWDDNYLMFDTNGHLFTRNL